jgi:pimeloyl-ACP methyl ester carboxylesterase
MPPKIAGYQSIQKIGTEQISYYDRGDGAAVVLIHGMFGDFLDWEPVLEPLAASHRLIAIPRPLRNSSKRLNSADFRHVRRFISGGAPLPVDLIEAFRARRDSEAGAMASRKWA